MVHGLLSGRFDVARAVVIAFAALIALAPAGGFADVSAAETAPRQPGQPTAGPGGSDYRFATVDEVHVGEAPHDAYIFVPDEVRGPALADLDVVLLIHGFMGIDPTMYEDWIAHLVRRGTIVIFPVYQTLDVVDESPPTWAANLFAGVQEAIGWLEAESGAGMRSRPVDLIGHSLGGPLAIRYALDAERLGFPVPRTLFVVQPGGCQPCGNFGGFGIDLPLDETLPGDLYAQMIVGDRDETVGDRDARLLWPMLDAIPADRKDYVTIRSDDRGTPPVIADHAAVGTGNRDDGIDVIDWFAMWRSHDALVACATTGEECATALGDTPEHRSMGEWSDGTAIVPLLITQGPPS